MRPIDADAYASEMRKRQDACLKWQSEQNPGSEMYARSEQALVTFIEARLTLENQPTIDAIPVEWLKEQAKDNDGYCGTLIRGLLSEWWKEQEAR